MVTSDRTLWGTNKSRLRLSYQNESGPRWVQIAGGDAEMLGEAAVATAELGADIIDINMGCPAKKVCKKAAGSALLRDPKLVQQIFRQVVSLVDVPVTVKIRLGWSLEEINAPQIAQIAEDEGISLISVHGRSRACKFQGTVLYDQIASVVDRVSIPVLANGDIQSAEQARSVLDQTGAAGVMLGRAAQGQPWLPGQVDHYLRTGESEKKPELDEIKEILTTHVKKLTEFYGELMGPRIARKHVGWYLSDPCNGSVSLLRDFNRLDSLAEQLDAIEVIFETEGGEVRKTA